MKIVDLIQGSSEWLAWRREHLTASMMPVIMGVSPYQTKLELYNNIINDTEQKKNSAMNMGSDREEEAREWLNEQTGQIFDPMVIESDMLPWAAASMDGLTIDLKWGCEIKWNNKQNHAIAKKSFDCFTDDICDHHYAQVQWQMLVTGLDSIYYVSCWKDDKIFFPVHRNTTYINNMLRQAISFLNCVSTKSPPDATEKDLSSHVPIICNDRKDSFDSMCFEYLHINEQIAGLTEIKKGILDKLKSMAEGETCGSGKYCLKKSVVKGSYDYKKHFESLDLYVSSQYQKDDTESWRVTEIKGE